MTTDGKRLRTGKPVQEIVDVSELEEAALGLFDPEGEPRAYVETLIQQAHYFDAVRFLAHALPRREAVWWAWVCAKRSAGEEPPKPIAGSLEATKQWIAEPSDEHRRTAMEKAEEADIATPAGSVGFAAFLSGDSLAPPDVEKVPPEEFAGAKALAGAVILSALSGEPDKIDEQMHAFCTQGMEVAEKTRLWEPPET